MIRYEIVSITAAEALTVRHQVLWPDKPPSFSMVVGDDAAQHFGIRIDGQLVCVASLYLSERAARLRKFATLPAFQGHGIGTQMLQYLIDTVKHDEQLECLWLDARETALSFYQRFGFVVEGERFHKGEIAYFRVSQPL